MADQDENNKVTLKKHLTLLDGVSLIVGIIISSGIFVSPVGVMTHMGSVGASLVIWFLMGLITALCALCYAELGTTIVSSGGEYIYLYTAFGALPAFLCLWTGFILLAGVANAASVLVFANYITRPIFPDCDNSYYGLKSIIAALTITLLAAINCFNVKWAAKVQIVFTFTKLAALILIAILGITHLAKGNTEYLEAPFEGSKWTASSVVFGLYSAFWSFGGWSYLNMLVGELKNPKRDLPLSIIISLFIVTSVYMVVSVSYSAVLSPEQLIQSPAVAVTFAEYTMGKFAFIMPLFVASSIFGGLNGGVLSVSRFVQMGAEKGHFPTTIAMLSVQRITPVPSIITMCMLVLIMLTTSDLFYLIELIGFGFSCLLVSVFSAMLYMRVKWPDIPRPIKLPLVIPVLMLVVNIMIVVITLYSQPVAAANAVALIALGIPLYLVGVMWKNKPTVVKDFYYKVTVLLQKIFLLIPQDLEYKESTDMTNKKTQADEDEQGLSTNSEINEKRQISLEDEDQASKQMSIRL